MSYTKLGSGVWMWPPFRNLVRHPDDDLGRTAQLMWFALYTTPEAKMQVPGMFIGSVTTIAESAGFPVDRARTALDRLIDDDLVEYDVQRRVLRLVALPDCGESPTNGNAIRGWWRRFQNIPPCAVRDAHVAVLGWILAEWCRVNGKELSKDHSAAWAETFGRVAIPAPRPRPKRHVQTSLLLSGESLMLPSGASESGSKDSTRGEEAYLSSDSQSGSRPNDFNRNSYNDRLTGVKRDQDPDRDQDRDQDPDLRGGAGGALLRLVPSTPFDADDLVEALAAATDANTPQSRIGKFPRAVTKSDRAALGRAIESLDNIGSGQGVLALLREYIASGARGMDFPERTLHEKHNGLGGISPALVCTPGWLALAIQQATSWKVQQNEHDEMLAASRRQLGWEA